MDGETDLEPDLRADLERVLHRIAAAGRIPDRGERELVIRLDTTGRVRWFTPSQVRVPASELEHGFDETAPAG